MVTTSCYFFPLVKSNERQMNCFAALPLRKKIFWDHFLGELRNQAWIGSRAFSSQYRKGTLLVYFDGERVVSKAIMTRKGKCYFGSLASIITNCLYFKPCLKCLEFWLVLLCNLVLVTQMESSGQVFFYDYFRPSCVVWNLCLVLNVCFGINF